MLPEASEFFTPLIYTLSVVAVIYTSLVALMQDDMKKLIAYSSVAHMGFVTIGIFTPNALGIDGSIIQMLSHGVVSAALFMGVGVVYDRLHTHEIARFEGLVNRMPLYAFTFMLFTLASVGLPGTSGFVGEVLVIVGVFGVNSWVALLAATGAFLSVAYMLWLYRRVFFGFLTKDDNKLFSDLRPNEIIAFVPLGIITLLMGIYPDLFLDPMRASVDHLLAQLDAARASDLALR
jgi:NADH-quinone oxidoreductase subunit M